MGRASIGASLLSGAECEKKNEKVKQITKRCRRTKSAPLLLFPAQRKIRKERSDFATAELWCRGRRPRRPAPVCLHFLTLSAPHLAHCFKPPYGVTFPPRHVYSQFAIKPNFVALRTGRRGRRPLHGL